MKPGSLSSARSFMLHRGGLAALFLLLFCASCRQGPFVRIHLDGRQTDVTKISVAMMIGERNANQEFIDNAELSFISLALPAGIRDTLNVEVKGYLTDGCHIASGSGSVDIADDIVYEINVQLREIATCGRATYPLTVTREPQGAGNVTSVPLGIDCGNVCLYPFRENTMVTLTATALPGSTFASWSGAPGCGSQPTCALTLTSELTVQAQFQACRGWCNETPDNSKTTLNAIYGNSANSIVAVGDTGTIMTWDGGRWNNSTSGTGEHLRGVTTPPDLVRFYVVGDRGTVLTQAGVGWAPAMMGVPMQQLNGIAAVQSLEEFIVGNAATYVKGSFVSGFGPVGQTAVTGKTLTAIAAAPAVDEHYVAGLGGFLLRCVSGPTETFTGQTVTGAPDLHGIWVGNTNVYAVGANGTVVRRAVGSTATVTVVTAPTNGSPLRAIWGARDESVIYAVGDGGIIVKSTNQGQSWTLETTNTTARLNGIWGLDAGTIYAVGAGGIMLRYRP